MKFFYHLLFMFFKFIPLLRFIKVRLKHLTMFIDVKTRGISKSLFVNKTREDDMIFLIKKFIPSFGDVVDCGSNIGFYPLLEGKLVDSNRRIICVEPDPRNLDLLNLNVSKFGDTRYEVIHAGISSKSSTMSLDISRESNLNFITEKTDSPETIDVKTISLDELIADLNINPSFLRMDIEGHEVEVFKGANNWASTSKSGSMVLFETHSPLYLNKTALEKSLTSFKDNNFVVKCIVSSGGSGDIIMKKYNLISTDIIHSDGFKRHIFWDVDFLTACNISSEVPKLVRYMLLIKG